VDRLEDLPMSVLKCSTYSCSIINLEPFLVWRSL
jgi:hypothetical protein